LAQFAPLLSADFLFPWPLFGEYRIDRS